MRRFSVSRGVVFSRRTALVIAACVALALLAFAAKKVFGTSEPEDQGAVQDEPPSGSPKAAKLGNRPGSVLRIYLSPTGSDSNSGRSPQKSLQSLAGAHKVLAAAKPRTDVEIRIAPGEYVAPQTIWQFYIPGRSISFMPIDYDPKPDAPAPAARPIFRSNGVEGWWLDARLPTGHQGGDANLRFYYLQVERYSQGGLKLDGGTKTNVAGVRVAGSAGLNRNLIHGMVFRNLGEKYAAAGLGYGAVDLINSSDNVIQHNEFRSVENRSGNAALIHGIYLAHWSARNTVTENTFHTISGDPIRVRNDSNDNRVTKNSFERTGGYAFSDWFCDAACVGKGPGRSLECPSHGNSFRHNRLVSGFDGRRLASWWLLLPNYEPAEASGCTNEGQRRLLTSDNS